MAYQGYFHNKPFTHVGSVSLGETLGLLEGSLLGGQWQLGIQGCVFAIFDIGSDSHDLINADYLAGLPLSYRRGLLSLQARLFHQSSHLGDEYLLRGDDERINLSYESVDLKASFDLWDDSLRLYAGGGYLFDQDPEDLEPWSAQAGAEWRSPHAFLDGLLRPLAAVDLQLRQENDWGIDVSARAGVQLQGSSLRKLNLQLLVEYYNGRSPNGQFFERYSQFLGFGIHFHFE
jgi:hypothetical protein